MSTPTSLRLPTLPAAARQHSLPQRLLARATQAVRAYFEVCEREHRSLPTSRRERD